MTVRRLLLAFSLALPLAGALGGCTVNPATGGRSFTAGMTTAQEIEIGGKYHPRIVKQFGGEYGSPELRRYVAGVGARLAKGVERKDLQYRFTVLNSPVVNAFATPGGYIYITRGLLALADDEAQLAGVLAHELGHQAALHHARRFGQGLLTSLLVTTLGGAQAGQLAGGALLSSFSREHEREADDLGLRYMSRAGYDPRELGGFLSKLRADARLRAKLMGKKPEAVDEFDFLATHPAPLERVRRLAAEAGQYKLRGGATGRDVYQREIDGILYGDDPSSGFVRGRVFTHPKLGFRFVGPEGFHLVNTDRAVIGIGPAEARLVFDRAPPEKDDGKAKHKPGKPPPVPTARHYLTRVWAKDIALREVRSLAINGLNAATGVGELNTRHGRLDFRLVAIRLDDRSMYRFLFATPPAETSKLAAGFNATMDSFRKLTPSEISTLKPMRLHIVRVRPGDTVKSLSGRMAVSDLPEERFRVLNGLTETRSLVPGQTVKIVTE